MMNKEMMIKKYETRIHNLKQKDAEGNKNLIRKAERNIKKYKKGE